MGLYSANVRNVHQVTCKRAQEIIDHECRLPPPTSNECTKSRWSLVSKTMCRADHVYIRHNTYNVDTSCDCM